MEKCLNCGKEIDNDVNFCEFCGEKQIVKNKKKGFIIGIAILILVVIGGFGYNYYQEITAENIVAHLFDSNQALNEEITKDDIANATKKVDHVIDSELKSKLTVNLQAAKQQYDLHTNLEKEIEFVFNDGDIQEDVTRDIYDNLVSMNESVKNVTVKELFTEKLNEVEEFIENIEEENVLKDTAELSKSFDSQNSENISEDVFKETVEPTLEHTASSFIGAWTTSNLIINISEEEVAIGVQGSDNGVFGEIIDQSFDSTTSILNVSIVSLANSFEETAEDEYFDFAFKLKKVDGEMYIEYDGEDYIRNDAF